jgi:YaiO family outer membrane protein
MNDFQAEADYYYVTGDNGYFYFNYGISIGNKLFPGHRIGAEYFFSGADLMDVSLGGRFLSYSNFKVWIVTGQAGKYFHNVWLALRPFAVFYEGGTGFALTGNCRLYAVNPANYWGIEAGYGHSPDDRYTISSTGELFKLIAYRVKAEKNISLSFSDELKVSAGYSNEEFIENTFRNRFIIEVLFRHRF